MTASNRSVSVLLVGSLASVVACTQWPSTIEDRFGGREDRAPSFEIAVAPVTLAPEIAQQQQDTPLRHADSATHVGHYLSEALLDTGIEVMPPHDSAGILADFGRTPDLHRDASRLARGALELLGVDALLLVEMTRWSPRDPIRDPRSGSAVAFRATLHGGPEGLLLWSGAFAEQQAPFFESPWRALRYPGMGTHWLSVTELARWGARQLAEEMPLFASAAGRRRSVAIPTGVP